MKRKHRILLEVTFDDPISARLARNAIQLVLDDADKERSLGCYPTDITKVVAKDAERVIRASMPKPGPKSQAFKSLEKAVAALKGI